jgi:hypothetical protein
MNLKASPAEKNTGGFNITFGVGKQFHYFKGRGQIVITADFGGRLMSGRP